MTALDYFLYDNRTWSPRWGRDWGLKAATGALAQRADLHAEFDRYCGSMLGDQGQLRGFGEAIGGVRSRNGFLLCVALESSDSFGRPSWAVFGLWCPDPATLEQVLSAGDPIGSARALLGSETPPAAIEIQPARSAVEPRRRRHTSAEPEFHRFEPGSTVRDVISLLLGAVQAGAVIPNVLGVTATSRLPAAARETFNLVYCLPMDDRTERALARLRSQEPAVGEVWAPPARPPAPPAPAAPRRFEPAPPARPEPSSPIGLQWLMWLSLGIAGAVVLLLLAGEIRRDDEDVPASGDPMHSESPVPGERSAEAVLDEIGERLAEWKELSPDDLRQSPGFQIAETLEVLPEHQERRNRVRQAYSALIEVRDCMVKRQEGNWVAYYYDETGKDMAPAERLQKIAEILGEAPLGSEECQVLKESFGFEFENGDSVVGRWCDSLERLEKTSVRSLAVLDKIPG